MYFYWMLKGRIAVPVNREEWYMQDIEIRRVAEDEVDDLWISTVFIGLNHNFGADDRSPHLFETMVFWCERSKYQERYSSWDQAEAGHARIVQSLRDGTFDWEHE